MKLRPAEAVTYIILLSIAREKARDSKSNYLSCGVTVSELSKRMGKSDSATRAVLNSLKEKGLVEAKSSSVCTTLYGSRNKGREKIWLPVHKLDDEAIIQVLREHPEIIEYVGIDKIQELLGISLHEPVQLLRSPFNISDIIRFYLNNLEKDIRDLRRYLNLGDKEKFLETLKFIKSIIEEIEEIYEKT